VELPRTDEKELVPLDAMLRSIEEHGALAFEKVVEFILPRGVGVVAAMPRESLPTDEAVDKHHIPYLHCP